MVKTPAPNNVFSNILFSKGYLEIFIANNLLPLQVIYTEMNIGNNIK